MPSQRLPRRIAIATMIGIAGVCLSQPVLADQPVVVTFQAGNPWTQEIGSVSHDDAWHDYTVAAEAGKTFQINLVSRNPNVFFKVKQQGERKTLVDTFKTGATTWSTQDAAATTYEIHVYVQPEAMQRGDVAKYALQIGQYGAQDMQPASTEVTFQDNNPWAQTVGALASDAAVHDFTVAIAAGKTMQVNLLTQNNNVHFKVEDQASHAELVDSAKTGASTWSGPITTAGTYVVRVYTDPAAVPPGTEAKFALQIGQYASEAPAPAVAGSVAVPSTAASVAEPAASGTH
ncbi:MAG: hypothetical protein JSR56_01460 [Proteobacteria bacterium]|nr:hypothetical protein [Pseudomonadota bacterium]